MHFVQIKLTLWQMPKYPQNECSKYLFQHLNKFSEDQLYYYLDGASAKDLGN